MGCQNYVIQTGSSPGGWRVEGREKGKRITKFVVKSHVFQFGPCLLFMWMLNCPPAFKLYFKLPRLIYKNLLIKHCKLISEHLHFLTFLFTKVVTYLLLNLYSNLVKLNLITLNDRIKIKGFENYSKI